MDFPPGVLLLEMSIPSRIDREKRRASRFYKETPNSAAWRGSDVGIGQAKLLLFQGLFAGEGCYFGLRASFSISKYGCHKAAPALEEYINRPPPKLRDVVL
jgi:hypothetical protein